MGSEGHLLQVVYALGATGGLSGRLHRWQQQSDQYGDNCDNNQQLDKGEAAADVYSLRMKAHITTVSCYEMKR